MPLLRQVPRSEVDSPVVLTMYDQLFDGRDPVAEPGTATGTPGNWWTVFALVPDILEHATRGFTMMRSPERVLDSGLKELGRLRAGWVVGSQFVFSQHCKAARSLGLAEEKIDAVPHWEVATCYSDKERAFLAFADALVLQHGRVAPEVGESLRSHASDVEILEYTYSTTTYAMHATISRALRLEYDDVDERIVEVAAPEGYEPIDVNAAISYPQQS